VIYGSVSECRENCYDIETGSCYEQSTSIPTGQWRCTMDNTVYSSESECNKKCISYRNCVEGVCPNGFYYTSGQCHSWPECPSGGTFDYWNGVCYLQPSLDICPEPYSYAEGKCHHEPVCPGQGILNTTVDLCFAEPSIICPEGTTYNYTYELCIAIPICKKGEYVPDKDVCQLVMNCSEEYKCPLPNGSECREIILEDTPRAASQFDTHEADLSFYENDGTVNADGCEGMSTYSTEDRWSALQAG
jgi:hypothetical protein